MEAHLAATDVSSIPGARCPRTIVLDAIDAALAQHDDQIVTSDPDDLASLIGATGLGVALIPA